MNLPTLFDHVVYAVPDLEQAVATFAEVTGAEPVLGGAHPGAGTKNYLVALRWDEAPQAPRTSYLELVGLDPEQPDVPAARTMFGVGELGTGFRPRIHTWAIHPADLDATARSAAEAGVEIGEVRASSRRTPSGATLAWRLSTLSPLPMHGMQPFLIDWGTTPHPAGNELPVLTVTALHAEYPQPDQLRHVYDVLGVEIDVRAGLVPALVLDLDTPHGAVTLR